MHNEQESAKVRDGGVHHPCVSFEDDCGGELIALIGNAAKTWNLTAAPIPIYPPPSGAPRPQPKSETHLRHLSFMYLPILAPGYFLIGSCDWVTHCRTSRQKD
jgi:hypothetical protein